MSDYKPVSPEIVSFSWGEIKTTSGTFKDAKLYPGGARAWDWTESGTHHVPGIQPVDAQELVDRKADLIILSKGVNERLQTADKTIEYLTNCGCRFFVLQSEEAVAKYNEERKNHAVGALIHSTC